MNKRKILANFLSILDRLEDFYKIANKKLNANKLSKKIESLMRRRFDVLKLLSSNRYREKLKLILNKKLELPNYLTTDGFSKGLRLFIKNKYGLTSKLAKNEKNKKRLNRVTLKNKLYISSRNLINNLISRKKK